VAEAGGFSSTKNSSATAFARGIRSPSLVTVTQASATLVAIPKPLREELHLEAGDALEMEVTENQITLRPVRGTGPLTKEHGVWVFHRGRPLPASATDEML
jgi:AbrB family looped-hinge helix DNA binding protein